VLPVALGLRSRAVSLSSEYVNMRMPVVVYVFAVVVVNGGRGVRVLV
jgi:hypothetical protein